MARMVFCNYGGNYQLRIQTAEDFEHIQTLDDARWVATSAPVSGLNCDPLFLTFMDTDCNGRIRTDEVKAAQSWLLKMLRYRDRVAESSDVLRLADIDTSHAEGSALRAAAERILSNLNCTDIHEISLSQVRDLETIMSSAAHNGDGVIPPEDAGETDTAEFITVVMECIGSAPDASGKDGVTKEHIERFFQEAQAYVDWKAQGELHEPAGQTDVMPWGAATPSAYDLMDLLDDKIEQYFTQCDIIRFDIRAAEQMRLRDIELEELDFSDCTVLAERLRQAPLSTPNRDGVLDLDGSINPLYRKQIAALRTEVLNRALGESVSELTGQQWNEVKSVFAAYCSWLANKQGETVEKLDSETLEAYLTGPYRNRVNQLIATDKAVAQELEQIHNVEKLIMYQRWLMEFANNFVSFPMLYDQNHRSLIEMGTLIIDGRELTFTIKVDDRQTHKTVAETSFMYLLYVEVTGKEDKSDKFDVVAAVTSGDAGGLRIGKRGIFFTTDGREWDAQVVDIVSNPVSMWEFLKAPFQQIADFVKKHVERFSKTQEAKFETTLSSPPSAAATRDLLLGGSIAIAALGSTFALMTNLLSKVEMHHILYTILGIAFVVLVPGFIMGFLKLKRRDMSAILEASGWAINIRMKMTRSLGRLFTRRPKVPKDGRKQSKDVLPQILRQLGDRSFNLRRTLTAALIAIVVSAVIFLIVWFAIPLLMG